MGGVWCPGTGYTEEYRNSYFVGDFSSSGWIRQVIFDENDNAVEVRDFEGASAPL